MILHQQQQHYHNCTGKPNFIHIGPSTPELWRHMIFSSWWQLRCKSTSGFRFGDVLHLRRFKAISTRNFDNISQCVAAILLLPVFNKPPTYWLNFRFRHRPFYCHRHVILYCFTKFYANWMIADGVMTSYRFYKMVAIASQIYFRFLIWLI